MTCRACQTRAEYSLACLDCCRRLYKNTVEHNRPAILDMILAYAPDDIADRVKLAMTTTKSSAGSASTMGGE
jgi:hypothetical protein